MHQQPRPGSFPPTVAPWWPMHSTVDRVGPTNLDSVESRCHARRVLSCRRPGIELIHSIDLLTLAGNSITSLERSRAITPRVVDAFPRKLQPC